MNEHSPESRRPFKRLALTLAAGAILGGLSPLLGYGAAGGLLLTVLGGSVWLLFSSGHPRNPWVLNYCALAVSSFYIFGHRNISDSDRLEISMILGAIVAVPWLVAVAVDLLCQARYDSKKKGEEGRGE